MNTYQYPQSLIDYLTEQESEGNEIFISQSQDAVSFIIPMKGLGKWITVIQWQEGLKDFSLVNITGTSFDRLYKTMGELNDSHS